MGRLVLVALVAGGLFGSLAGEASAGVGSCYEPKPICISGRPVCVCDYAMRCFWSCQ